MSYWRLQYALQPVMHLRLRPSALNVSAFSSRDCFALLDDSSSGNAPRSSRTKPVYSRERGDADSLAQTLNEMQAALAQGLHAVGVFSYELNVALHGIAPHPGDVPPIRFLLFQQSEKQHTKQTEHRLAERDASDAPAG